ncbi:MAG: hypothetical protein LBS28_04395 [Streptococcaceae bacterium]|nr:hypothetical protein [Streptococcaceae bacterium]
MIKLEKLKIVLSLVMLSLIVSVFSVSEECAAVTEEEARAYLQMSLFPEKIKRLKDPKISWEELDSIIKKIYPCLNVASYEKLVKAMEATPGGILWFVRDVFENYKKENEGLEVKQFLDEFELYF